MTVSPRILLVEDDEALVTLLRYNLEAEGFVVDVAMSGDEAATGLSEYLPDLIILDWMLPGISGIELCRRLRARAETQALPILMLTARGEERDTLRALSTGADDYMTKPFSTPELIARIRGLLRRSHPSLLAESIRIADFELDRAAHRLRRNGRELHLGPTEFRLLEFLMMNSGRVFSREQLLDAVWGANVYVDERTVDVHIGRLRKSINGSHRPDPIRTVRGAGYSFDETYGKNSRGRAGSALRKGPAAIPA